VVTKVSGWSTLLQGLGWGSSLFQPGDVKAILSNSICDIMEDYLEWHFDPKDTFSVKSAYKVGIMFKG
jgi:hypothetical protein